MYNVCVFFTLRCFYHTSVEILPCGAPKCSTAAVCSFQQRSGLRHHLLRHEPMTYASNFPAARASGACGRKNSITSFFIKAALPLGSREAILRLFLLVAKGRIERRELANRQRRKESKKARKYRRGRQKRVGDGTRRSWNG